MGCKLSLLRLEREQKRVYKCTFASRSIPCMVCLQRVSVHREQFGGRIGSSLLLAGLDLGLSCALDSLSLALDLLCELARLLLDPLDNFVLLKYI